MKTWIIVGAVGLVLVAIVFFARRASAATVAAGSQVPSASPPAGSGGAVGFFTNVFANRQVGNAICSIYGGKGGTCSKIADASQKVTAAQLTLAKSSVTTSAAVGKSIVTNTAQATAQLLHGNVTASVTAAAGAATAPIKGAISGAKSVGHAISSIF